MAKEFKIFVKRPGIVERYEVETYDQKTLATTISYAFADLFTLIDRKNATTKTVKIPATDNNRKFFGFPEDFNSKANIDQNDIPIAWVEGDGTEIISGPIKLNVTNELLLESIKDYELVIQGDNGDWRARLSGTMLNEISYEDQNHILSNANIIASETIAAGRNYVYDLIDRGVFVPDNSSSTLPYRQILDSNGNLKWTVSEVVREDCRYPALNIVDMVRRSFKQIGYKVVSLKYLDDADVKKLYWIFTEERLRHPESFNENNTFHLTAIEDTFYSNINTMPPGTTQGTDVPVAFLTEDSDAGNNAGIIVYRCPTNAQYNFKTVLRIAPTIFTNGTTGVIYMNVMKYDSITGNPSIVTQQTLLYDNAHAGLSTVTIETGLIDCVYNDAIGVTFSLWLDNASAGYNSVHVFANSTFECTEISGICDVHAGQLVDFNYNLPSNISVIEFLQGLKGIENLLFITDVNSRTVTIERWDDFFYATAKEMSHKLDASKLITTKYIGDQHFKTIRYQYKSDSNDAFVSEWEKQNNIPFGSCDRSNTNAYAKDGVEVFENNIFSATWMDHCEPIGFHSDLLPRMWSDISRPVRSTKFNPRILYYAGITSMAADEKWVEVDSISSTFTQRSTFPRFFSFDDSVENENNLLFCDTDLSHGMTEKHWRNTHKIICEGRMWDAFFKLSDLDIANLDYRYQWYVEIDGNGAYFIISEIKNYDGTDNNVTEVELLKLVSNVARVQLRRVVNRGLPAKIFRPPHIPTAFDVITISPIGGPIGRADDNSSYQSGRYGGREIFRIQDNQVRIGNGSVYYNDPITGEVKEVFTQENGKVIPVIIL